MKKIKFFILCLTLSFTSSASDIGKNTWDDILTTFSFLFKGSVQQFKEKNNLYYTLGGAPLLAYSFEHDDRLTFHAMTKPVEKHHDLVGDLGVALSFPIIPVLAYSYGRSKNDDKAIRFAMEYAATMYLTLAETAIISLVDVHERPNKEGQSKWETAFRGDSSFPSGHVVPYATLFFKTLQFYGPYWSVLPATLTYFSAMQRVREGRHYVSDIVGSLILSAWASEGVRAVSGYQDNHPFYKWLFESEAELSYIRYKGVIGPKITFKF